MIFMTIQLTNAFLRVGTVVGGKLDTTPPIVLVSVHYSYPRATCRLRLNRIGIEHGTRVQYFWA